MSEPDKFEPSDTENLRVALGDGWHQKTEYKWRTNPIWYQIKWLPSCHILALLGLRCWTCFPSAILLQVRLTANSTGQEGLKYISIHLTGVPVGLTVAGSCARTDASVSVCHWVVKKDLRTRGMLQGWREIKACLLMYYECTIQYICLTCRNSALVTPSPGRPKKR